MNLITQPKYSQQAQTLLMSHHQMTFDDQSATMAANNLASSKTYPNESIIDIGDSLMLQGFSFNNSNIIMETQKMIPGIDSQASHLISSNQGLQSQTLSSFSPLNDNNYPYSKSTNSLEDDGPAPNADYAQTEQNSIDLAEQNLHSQTIYDISLENQGIFNENHPSNNQNDAIGNKVDQFIYSQSSEAIKNLFDGSSSQNEQLSLSSTISDLSGEMSNTENQKIDQLSYQKANNLSYNIKMKCFNKSLQKKIKSQSLKSQPSFLDVTDCEDW